MNNDPKIMGVTLPKKWSGQNLTSDYGPVDRLLTTCEEAGVAYIVLSETHDDSAWKSYQLHQHGLCNQHRTTKFHVHNLL